MLYFDEKGPLILSASVHFALIVFFVVYFMVRPEKKPEELVFELYSPPMSAPQAVQERPIEYTPEPSNLPTLDDIEIPEPVIEDELVPEPPEEILREVEPAPPKQSYEDYKRNNPIPKPTIPKPRPRKPPTINIDVSQMEKKLRSLNIQVPTVVMGNANSAADQDRMMDYFAGLIRAITGSIDKHPLGAVPLSSRVEFELAPNGKISGARIVVSSGDSEFDRKVLEGFRRLGSHRAPPDWTSTQTLVLTILQPDR